MNFDINSHEQKIFNNQFPDCKKLEGRGDFIFVYSDEFQGDIYERTTHIVCKRSKIKP